MNQLTEEALDRLNDEQLHDLSSTIDKLLEGRRKRARCTSDAMEAINKALEQQESAAASDFILSFGKHKGARLRDVDLSCLSWAIGYKRSATKFTPPTTAYPTIIRWPTPASRRIWHGAAGPAARRSTAVRFRNVKLCTLCWLSSKDIN